MRDLNSSLGHLLNREFFSMEENDGGRSGHLDKVPRHLVLVGGWPGDGEAIGGTVFRGLIDGGGAGQ